MAFDNNAIAHRQVVLLRIAVFLLFFFSLSLIVGFALLGIHFFEKKKKGRKFDGLFHTPYT
jgi:hypothetical protein